MCSGLTHNMAGLIVCRCLLGTFEAAFGAGAPYFLSLFYQRHELGLRVSILLGMSPLANCFASALAYGITHIHTPWGAWRYLFIIGKLDAPKEPFNFLTSFFSHRGDPHHMLRARCLLLSCRLSRNREILAHRKTNSGNRTSSNPRHNTEKQSTLAPVLCRHCRLPELHSYRRPFRLQLLIRRALQFSSHNHQRYGLHQHQCPRPHRASLLRCISTLLRRGFCF